MGLQLSRRLATIKVNHLAEWVKTKFVQMADFIGEAKIKPESSRQLPVPSG